MRTYKLHIRALFLLAGILAVTSCEKDFDTINRDPNAITEVPSDYLLPGAIFSITSNENAFMENLSYASAWAQQISCAYWPTNGSYSYEKARGYLWDNLYSGPLKDLRTMYELAAAENNESQMAVSLVMSSYAYALLTDCYGPVPYSEALRAEEGINKPAYDDQRSVYLALIDSLRSASSMLRGKTTISIRQGYDLLFNGDARKWLKFANSLQLKLMMRISMKEDMAGKISTLVNNPETEFILSNSDNAWFSFPGTAPKNYNPFYSNLSSEATDGGYRLCNTLADFMNSNDDPRLPVYAVANDEGEYTGLAAGQGISSNDIEVYAKINPVWGRKDRPGTLIASSDVLFLLAEASQRGIISQDAAALYNSAIKANFQELGLSEADFTAYISQSAVSYNNTLQRIMEQKWVTLFTRGIEAWTEQRRTGYPALIPVAGGAVNVIPWRFQYPISEGQSNAGNLGAAIATLPNGDALDSKIWWINR